MDTDSFSVPVSLLRQYAFCPRIPFFYLIRNLHPPFRPWVKQGLGFHEKTQMLAKRRNLSRFGLAGAFTLEADVALKSETLHLHGICDAVLTLASGQMVPLEFKMKENCNLFYGSDLQLTAYAMLLEELRGQPVPFGFLLFGSKGKTLRIEFSEEIREKVRVITQKILTDCEEALMPSTAASDKQCSQCEYLNFCNDRL